MQAIKNKIRSRRGASLTFALLLFLVCAVVGSVVLVAGTAASGRMSQIAEMDQRYYSVNSAARLLIDTITKDEKIKTVKTTEYDSDGNPSTSYQCFVGADEVDISKGFPSLKVAAAYTLANLTDDRKTNWNVDFTAPVIDNDSDTIDLAVTGTETLLPDGSMQFELKNKSGTDTEKYVIRLTFSADKKQVRDLEAATGREIITTTIKWTLSDIENAWKKPNTGTGGG